MDGSDNFKLYRKRLQEVKPPCIPYIGIFQKEITYIEETSFDILDRRPDMINFEKCKKLAYVIREVLQYQIVPYNLLPEPRMQIYLGSLELLSEETLWKMSLICEPRENKASRKDQLKSFNLIKSNSL